MVIQRAMPHSRRRQRLSRLPGERDDRLAPAHPKESPGASIATTVSSRQATHGQLHRAFLNVQDTADRIASRKNDVGRPTRRDGVAPSSRRRTPPHRSRASVVRYMGTSPR
jgi:hypothetical protein